MRLFLALYGAILLPWLAFDYQVAHGGQAFERVMERGVVSIGAPYNVVPQGFLNSSGKWVGFEVDMASEMARHMGLKLELVKVTPKTWGPLLINGEIDAALCRIVHTRALESEFDFSVAYFFDSLHLLVIKAQLNSVKELAGQKVAAVQGSIAERTAMNLLREAGDPTPEKNVVSYPDQSSCFMALGREKVAAWLDSGVTLLEYASNNPGRFELIRVTEDAEAIAAAVPENDSTWRDLINFTIQDMAGNGTLQRLHAKWFGPDTPYAYPMARTIDIWPQ